MRRGRILIMVLAIIIIGLVVGFVAIRQFLQNATPDQPEIVNVPVFVAAQVIPQGEEITRDALTTINIPQENIGVMFTVDEEPLLVGKIAKFPLDPGVVITEAMVGDGTTSIPISGPQWASLIPTGQVAISVPTHRIALSGYAVNDGAHVNVTACFLFVDIDPAFQTALPNRFIVLTGSGFTTEGVPSISLGATGGEESAPPQGRLELDPAIQQPYYLIPSEGQRPRMVCQIILQDVVVLKVGNFPLNPNVDLSTQPAADSAEQPPATVTDIVTLLVSPQDSLTLSYIIQTNAQLTLTLRNPSDQARQATEASTLQFLLSQYNVPVPAKLPYSLEPYTTKLFGVELHELINPTPTEEQ